ncbi:hypothetical protein TL16_g05954 [Triparma laevis f. inornata]|uniref:Uncharacterized protein n=1 Tax=Triparma laevis f. inornata TaxID=1714386 RepID=A0A9W7ARF7_9STRA|nr:hypothetical protein TL16_g05954 [Triparma laevis f. inornata]
MPHKPVKINDDKDLKTIQDYFSRPPRPERDFDAEEKARKQEEARLAQEEEEEARVRGLYDAEMEAQAEVKRRTGAEGGKEKDILSGFSEKDFVAPIKELSEAKKRDYGYGVPQWSPYRMTKVTSTPEWKEKLWSTTNAEWGIYSKQKNTLDPATQSRLARGMVKEMKANASIDHTWEVIGRRPGQDPKNKFFMP